jgi:U32 family peptidase
MKKIELLAPAGNLKKLKVALKYGADAVYCGLPGFSLRAKTGFTIMDLEKGISYAHKLNKKVYVTINIIAHNRHLRSLPGYLQKLKKLNPDAVIVADPGVMTVVKKYLPKTEIHLSTQANTLNYEAVKFWQKQGVKRIILGREVAIGDIKEIRKKAKGIGLEVFVHGAMCMSYSGRCYLSTWLSGRSANEGLCTQPCRWDYKVYIEEKLRPGKMIPVLSDKNGSYILNSKDLCLAKHLDKIIEAGVGSIKIEGRAKSIYYLAAAVRTYRLLLDGKIKIKDALLELNKIDNRGYTTGFLLGADDDIQQFDYLKEKNIWGFAGEVVSCNGQKVTFKVHNVLRSGDKIEIVTPSDIYILRVKKLYDNQGVEIAEAHGGTKKLFSFELDKNYDILEGSLIRKMNK